MAFNNGTLFGVKLPAPGVGSKAVSVVASLGAMTYHAGWFSRSDAADLAAALEAKGLEVRCERVVSPS